MNAYQKRIAWLFFFSILFHIIIIAYLGYCIDHNRFSWRKIKVDMRILDPKPNRYIPMHRQVPRDPPPDKLLPPPKPQVPELTPKNLEPAPKPRDLDLEALDFTDSPYGEQIGYAARDFNYSTDNRDALLSAYRIMVNKSIQEKKRYPSIARKMGYEGVVRVEFSVSRQGELLDMRIVQGAGFQILDNAALETIRAAAPFPSVPVYLEEDKLTMQIDLVYQLK